MNKRSGKYVALVGIVAILAGITAVFLRTEISADIQFGGQSGVKVLVNDMVNIPVEEATVTLQTQNGTVQIVKTPDATGFYVSAARPGTYTLTVSAPGYISDTKTIELSQGEHEEVRFFLSAEL
ncbi:MAG TPA: carboxypeptidase regulatory-like domain-containing protein [Patescibacteria group bacterium]